MVGVRSVLIDRGTERSEGGSPTNVAASMSQPPRAFHGKPVWKAQGSWLCWEMRGKLPSPAVEIQAASNQKLGHNSFLKEKEKFNNGFLKG